MTNKKRVHVHMFRKTAIGGH